MQELFYYIFIIVGFSYLLHMGLFVVGGNIYDILEFRRNKKLDWRVKKYRPVISVLIPAFNEEKVIERCLNSVTANRYKNFEIIVINDASTDNTATLVKKIIKEKPNKNIKLINRKKNYGKASGLTYALKKHAKGELVMVLDGDAAIAHDALRKATNHFVNDKVSGLAANVRVIEDKTILNLLQRFEYLISYRAKKFYSVAGAELIVGGVGSVYRREIVKKFGYYSDDSWTEDIGLSMKIAASGSKNNRLIYAMDVIAYTESVESLRGLFTQRYRWKLGNLQNLIRFSASYYRNRSEQNAMMLWYRIPVSYISEFLLLLEPFLVAFALYISIMSQNIVVFASAYVLLMTYTFFVLWSDEYLGAPRKALLSLYVPSIYFLLYIMSLVQITAAVRCLVNFKKLITKQGGAWLSPSRAGHVVGSES